MPERSKALTLGTPEVSLETRIQILGDFVAPIGMDSRDRKVRIRFYGEGEILP